MHFEYTILPSELHESDLTVRGDTVSFVIYYVDVDCGSSYGYEFEKRKRLLVVKRTLLPEAQCAGDEEFLYGVEGFVAGVPKGIYGFVLEAENNSGTESFFTEPVQVK
jgi:hypothetical protein